MTCSEIISDVPILPDVFLVLFKAKAWLDLSDRKASGQSIDEKDIRKHMNDVARLSVLLTGNESCVIPESVFADITKFIEAFETNPPDMKSLRITGVSSADVVDLLRKVYSTQ